MIDILWILGVLVAWGLGVISTRIYYKMKYEAEFKEIQRDVFSIVYDIGIEQEKKTPFVIRINRIHKYFNLDEIEEERDAGEQIISPSDLIGGDNISSRISVNADGTQGVRRGVKEDEWVR